MTKKRIKVFQTSLFSRKIKKLSKKQKKDLDKVVQKIVDDPFIGEKKRGDLSDVFIYKFKSSSQQLLVAYQWDESSRTLLMIGIHENFYRDLKKFKKR